MLSFLQVSENSSNLDSIVKGVHVVVVVLFVFLVNIYYLEEDTEAKVVVDGGGGGGGGRRRNIQCISGAIPGGSSMKCQYDECNN